MCVAVYKRYFEELYNDTEFFMLIFCNIVKGLLVWSNQSILASKGYVIERSSHITRLGAYNIADFRCLPVVFPKRIIYILIIFIACDCATHRVVCLDGSNNTNF